MAVNRDDLAPKYLEFLNEGLKESARVHSWDELKEELSISFSDGDEIKELPDRFKEFQNGRFCAEDSNTNDGIPVYNKTELEKFVAVFKPERYILLTQRKEKSYVTFKGNLEEAVGVDIFYFAYPETLEGGEGETSPLLTAFPDMVLAKAIALTFKSINDPAWEVHEQAWRDETNSNAGEDVLRSNPAPRSDKE